jgi:hypothetical protein
VAATRVFVSYDYDNDSFLKEALVGQSRLPDSPFVISDWSVKVASPNWRNDAQRRIRTSDVVAVLCGTKTHLATGVAGEVKIAQQEGISYFLLKGYSDKNARSRRPRRAPTRCTNGRGTT